MKGKIFLAGLLVYLSSCGKQAGWIIENPLPEPRPDEVIIFSRNEIAAKLAIPGNKLPVFTMDGKQLVSQVDDLDGDGRWDETILLTNFPPSASRKIVVSFIDPANFPVFEKRTNLRLGIIQPDGTYSEVNRYLAPACKDSFRIIAQAESVSWENDKFGFRNYFDCRNVKDLFGKLKPEMIIDSLGFPGSPDYHTLSEWGMDVLHCGSSLGAGGIALRMDDSLFRLGSTEVFEFKKITEGAVRSVFELRYAGWDVNGYHPEAVEKISVYPGKYWFQSDVTITDLPEGAEIVTGIVTTKLKRNPFHFTENGFTCIGTHDKQSLNDDELGMAVILPENETSVIERTSDINFFELGCQTVPEKSFSQVISETYYVSQKAVANSPARHYFASVWGLENERWKSEEEFRKYLGNEILKLANPLIIKRLHGEGVN